MQLLHSVGKAIIQMWRETVWHVRRHRRFQIGKFGDKLMLLKHTEGISNAFSPRNKEKGRQQMLVKSALVSPQIIDMPSEYNQLLFFSSTGDALDVGFISPIPTT